MLHPAATVLVLFFVLAAKMDHPATYRFYITVILNIKFLFSDHALSLPAVIL
jgi:hypothetical protein